ncbi:Hsp33 family molecular chaperone [Chelativorans salis]|uniref:Hsp33 family molecular chaperone n=1 Tax=Chelativorans salis TaxID=2978478 RepID=A0ABT2LIV6_9HYPH|nr:Hsp33 family molecular chaperone [Chelativorans sp. EGI FJ00035]MCT7374510.1 Hsp33 family molecular chaperone [Chelativorans sp. EGI FJ00035]
MSEQTIRLGEFGFAGDDYVVPFDVEALDVRGRAVQVGPMLDQILARHDYPEPVARLLAEVIVLTVLLGSSLKFDGKFIVQTRTDGPVDMLVADFTTPGSVRAYARFDQERLDEAVAQGEASPEALLGVGVLALTIDQGEHTQRYQGVVELNGSTLEDVARTYFRQSEQIPTEVRLGVARIVVPGDSGGERWRAGGLLLQFLPAAPERSRMADLPGGDGDEDDNSNGHPEDNAWQEALALVETVEPDELLDPSVGTERLLYRLFHEQGVRVYEGVGVKEECSCSRDKIKAILDGFTAEEIEESTEDGIIRVSCEFCSKEYTFDPEDFG